jgi:hypothetical protein
MDKKRINGTFDATAVDASELTTPPEGQDEASDQPESAVPPTAAPAGKRRPERVEHIVHRLAGRTVPRRSSRR